MDCVDMDPVEDVPPAATAIAATAARPRIIQLSPVPGNIYETDRFYYDCAAVMNEGPFRAVLAFATAHNHPTVVHDCPDIQEFQTAYPAVVVRPIEEVPPAIVARGLSLLAQASTNAEPPPVPAPAGASPPSGSRSLLSHVSLSCGGDPPSDGSRVVRTSVGARIPPVVRFPPAHVPQVAHPPHPDPDGIDAPPVLTGGRLFRGYVGSSPVYGRFPQEFTFPSTQSTADQWRTFTFPGRLPSSIPAFIHGPGQTLPSHGGSPHAPASVASMLALAAPPLRPLSHEDLSGSSSSNLTMSFWPASQNRKRLVLNLSDTQ
jgi:hypothetical protein